MGFWEAFTAYITFKRETTNVRHLVKFQTLEPGKFFVAAIAAEFFFGGVSDFVTVQKIQFIVDFAASFAFEFALTGVDHLMLC